LALVTVSGMTFCALVGLSASAATRSKTGSAGDWIRFGYEASRRNAGPASTRITRENVNSLVHRRVVLDGTVDSSPVYLRGTTVRGRRRDIFIVTTSYGKAIALDADSGAVLWRFVPPQYKAWAGSYRITTSSPVADPGRQFVYSAAPDGFVYKLRIASGASVRSGAWPVRVSHLPAYEKISSPLNIAGDRLLATTASFGDAGFYQGHVAVIDRHSGKLVHVWNALCSNTSGLLHPESCPWVGAGIWARSGVVVQPGTGNLIVATGNGVWDTRMNWSNSVVMLSPDANQVIGSWTPVEWQDLASQDLDVGSTAPALLTDRLAVQGGKDGKLRLLDLGLLKGKAAPPARVLGKELQIIPGGGAFFATPAVWRSKETIWLFVTSTTRLAAFTLTKKRLVERWVVPFAHFALGTSPVVAGGLLYVNNAGAGELDVFAPNTGKLVARLPAGPGHWNSPIVSDGRVALGEGDANAQMTTGALNIYSLRRPLRLR
jgi:outer membrane protein assembly factor BamB